LAFTGGLCKSIQLNEFFKISQLGAVLEGLQESLEGG
jgi:hypothetical protein